MKTQGQLDDFVREQFKDASNHTSRIWIERMWANVIDLRDVYDRELNSVESLRRSFRPPTLQNVIDGILDSVEMSQPDVVVEPVDKDSDEAFRAALAVQKARENINQVTNKDLADEESWRHAATEGIGISYAGYLKTENYDNMVHISIDPRDFIPDPKATCLYDPTGYQGCRYVFWHRRVNYSTWLATTQNDKRYYNEFAVQETTDSRKFYYSNEENSEGKFGDAMIDIYEFFCPELEVEKGKKRGVHAIFTSLNGNVTEHFIEPCSYFPFVTYYIEKRDDSFYGIPPALKLAPIIVQKDILANLIMKSAKVSAQAPLLIDSEAGFNKYEHKIAPDAVWQLKNERGVPIQNLITRAPIQTPGFQEFQILNQILDDELTIASNVNRRALFLNPQELATQTRAKMQNELKRMNRIIKSNTRRAEKRSAEIELMIMKQFLSGKKEIYEDGKLKKTVPRKIKVRGYLAISDGLFGSEIPRLEKTSSVSPTMFDLTEKIFDNDFEVIVLDKIDKIGMDEDTRGRLMQWRQLLSATVRKEEDFEVIKNVDMKIAQTLGFNTSDFFKEDVISTKSPLFKQLEYIALGGIPAEDPMEGMEETMERMDGLLKFLNTQRFKEFSPKQQYVVSDLITGALTKLRQPPQTQMPQMVNQMMPMAGGAAPGNMSMMSPSSPKKNNV